MPLPFLAAAVPWVLGAIGIAAVIGVIGAMFSDDDPNILLVGDAQTGKDTILGVLKEGTFRGDYDQTVQTKPQAYNVRLYGNDVVIINTAGAHEADKSNREMRRDLEKKAGEGAKITFVYVFRVDWYFGLSGARANTRADITADIAAEREYCAKHGINFKVVGTHRDICVAGGVSEADIRALEASLTNSGAACKIFDLTRARTAGEQVKSELAGLLIG